MKLYDPLGAETVPPDETADCPPVAPETEVPPRGFPMECFPEAVAGFVEAVAASERVPAALPGIIALGVLSGSLGSGLVVASGPQRSTPGNLYILGIAESGSGKSECYRLVARPMLEFQERLLEDWRKRISPQIQSELRIIEKEIGTLERKAAKTGDPADRERLRGELEYKVARRDELTGKSHPPLLIAQDSTTERLAVLLQQNAEMLFSTSADARKLVDNLLGRYSANNLTDESLYLSAYSGDHVRVDRQGREPVQLSNPCLSLLWLLQPDALELLFGEASLSASGFLPRCLIAHTRATPRRIEGLVPAVPPILEGSWEQLIEALLGTYHQPGVRHVIRCSLAANQALIDYHNEIVDRRHGDLSDVSTFAARWAEQAWRLSVVLHAATHGADSHLHELSLDTARKAIALAAWFAEEQLDLLTRGRQERARKLEDEVLELLTERWERQKVDSITARDVYRKRIVDSPEGAAALLARMQTVGLVTSEETVPAHGGRTTRTYRALIKSPVFR